MECCCLNNLSYNDLSNLKIIHFYETSIETSQYGDFDIKITGSQIHPSYNFTIYPINIIPVNYYYSCFINTTGPNTITGRLYNTVNEEITLAKNIKVNVVLVYVQSPYYNVDPINE